MGSGRLSRLEGWIGRSGGKAERERERKENHLIGMECNYFLQPKIHEFCNVQCVFVVSFILSSSV